MKEYETWSFRDKQHFYQLLEKNNHDQKINFKNIAAQLQSKTYRQCYDFYMSHKNRSEPRHVWNQQEEKTLITQANTLNKNWDAISTQFFPGFSRSQLRNKYNHLINKQHKQPIEQPNNDISSILTTLQLILSKQ